MRWVDTWVDVEDMEGSSELIEEWKTTGRNAKKRGRPRKIDWEEEDMEVEIVKRRKVKKKETGGKAVEKR